MVLMERCPFMYWSVILVTRLTTADIPNWGCNESMMEKNNLSLAERAGHIILQGGKKHLFSDHKSISVTGM